LSRPAYIVVRLEKHKGGAIRGMQIHDLRQRPGRSRTNPDIDWSRTAQNADLLGGSGASDFERAVGDRIRALGLSRIRGDAVRMVGALVSASPEWFEGRSREEIMDFYGDAFAFLRNRYGGRDGENIVSAVVHMDEATPHLHVNFVPATRDGRLSAKDVVGSRSDLRKLQDDMARYVGEPRGLSRGERESRARHVEIPELKRQTAELERRAAELERVSAEIERARSGIEALREEGRGLREELAGLRAQTAAARGVLVESRELLAIRPKAAPITGHVKGVTAEQVERLRDAAREALELKARADAYKARNERLRDTVSRERDARIASEERLAEVGRAAERDPELGKRLEEGVERDRAEREREREARERDRRIDRGRGR
jgi:hypothetical protein